MKEHKVILITKVVVRWEKLESFNKWWEQNSLPNWIAHGAKDLGSYECYLGEKKNIIMRIMQFDNLKKFQDWMDWRNTTLYAIDPNSAALDPTSPERTAKISKVTEHAESLEESVWFSIY